MRYLFFSNSLSHSDDSVAALQIRLLSLLQKASLAQPLLYFSTPLLLVYILSYLFVSSHSRTGLAFCFAIAPRLYATVNRAIQTQHRERKKWKYVEIRPGLYQRWQKKVEFIISWMALPRLTQNRCISNLKNIVRVSLYWCWKMNGNNILPQAIQSNNIYFKQVDHFLFLLAVLSYKKNFGDLSLLWSWIWHGVDVST